MRVIGLLLLIFLLQGTGGSCSDGGNTFCTAQRGTIIVVENGSVTIPCNFTFPKQKDTPVEVRVSWRRGGLERCGNGEFIYNYTGSRTRWDSTGHRTHGNYTGRISKEGNLEQGTTTITIRNLRRTDRPMFCCRIEMYEGSTIKQGWQNRHGTFIQFKDDLSVEQTDVVPAIIGEDITIPCLVHYKSSDIIKDVTWTVGINDLCADNNERSEIWKEENKTRNMRRWSVGNFPQDLSLRIRNVTSEDEKQYCCKVRTRLRGNNAVSSIHGTRLLLVASKDPKFEVVQPEMTSADPGVPVTLSCSFTPQSHTDLLWSAVFWRVGNPSGIYAYHPLIEMVDSSYRGRTELRGLSDLHIMGVKDTDDTTYYCFVMLRFCVGNNETISNIRHGSGTKLTLRGSNFNSLEDSGKNTWIYVLAAVLAVLIFCVVVIIILNKKGVICQKRTGREDVNHLTSDFALKDRHPSDNEQIPSAPSSALSMAQEESEGVLYAHLNKISLQQKTSNGKKASNPDNDSQVLYATVKPTAPPQDIYSTVKK